MKNALITASRILPMDISEICVSPARIFPSIDFGGSCGNDNLHLLVDIIFPPFGSTTVVGGFLIVICSWGYLVFMQCLIINVSSVPVLGSKVIILVGPPELT